MVRTRWLPGTTLWLGQSPRRVGRRIRLVQYPALACAVLLTASSAHGDTAAHSSPTTDLAPARGSWSAPAPPFTALIKNSTTDPQTATTQVGKVSNIGISSQVRTDMGVPATVLSAYREAERLLAQEKPSCHLGWAVLAGIGKVESGHANSGSVRVNGDMLKSLYGPALNGLNGTVSITSPQGWARAAGPMQMLPSTWQKWGSDANNDGRADPQNIYDAAVGAGRYLCASGSDLNTEEAQHRAILSYNHSESYYQLVTYWIHAYQNGHLISPNAPYPYDINTPTENRHATEPDDTSFSRRQPDPTPRPAEPAKPPEAEPKPKPQPAPAPFREPLRELVSTANQLVSPPFEQIQPPQLPQPPQLARVLKDPSNTLELNR